MKNKKILIIGLIIIAVILIAMLATVVFQKQILTAWATRTIQQRFIEQAHKYEDGLYAGLAGTGSPMPDINRTGPCTVVMAAGNLYLVDTGQGSARNVARMGFQLGQVKAVLLTHFHSDHIADLGEVMMQRWTGGSNTIPLDVIGPPGVETVVEGFNLAYSLDSGYRVAHHGSVTAPPSGAGGTAKPFNLSIEEDASVVVIDDEGLKVTAFKVNHAPVSPAVGYRFDYKGRTLLISGDTVPCSSLKKQTIGVDVLIHEALQPSMVKILYDQAGLSPSPSLAKMMEDIPGYHSSPEDVAKIAGETGVKHLILYHVTPPIAHPLLNNLYLGEAGKFYKGPITIAEDGMLISMPAGSDKINIKEIMR